MTDSPPISPDLLEILRDPYAIQHRDQFGADPGQLTLIGDSWLVSADTGYKYPIRDGIPVMLIEEGQRWKDTPVEALPVPPPAAAPAPTTTSAAPVPSSTAKDAPNYLLLAGGAVLVVLGVFAVWRWFSSEDDTPAQ